MAFFTCTGAWTAHAGNNTWDGSASTDWNTAANWSRNRVPTSADTAVINTSGNGNQPVVSSSVGGTPGGITLTSGTLTIQTGGSLATSGGTGISGAGKLTMTGGALTVGSASSSGSDFSVTGTVSLSGGLLKIGHDYKPTATKVTATGGTVQFFGSAGGGGFGIAGTYRFYNVVVDAGFDPNFDGQTTTIIAIAGSLTLNGTTAVPFPTRDGSTAGSLFLGTSQQVAGTYTGNGEGTRISDYLSGSGRVTVGFGAVNKLEFTTPPSSSTVAGVAFATPPVVKIQDASGNTITTGADSTASVTLTLVTGTGTLGGTVTMTAVAGVVDFSGMGLNINLEGSDKVLRATATLAGVSKTTDTSPAFTVVAASATQTRVETAADGTGTVVSARNVTAGSSATVYAITRDTYGNFVGNPSATWSLQSKTVGVVGGDLVGGGASAVFTGHLVGTATIRAVTSFTGDSGAQAVTPAAASKLAITTSPVTVTVGAASSSITVQRQDSFGNPNTADADRTVTLSSNSTGTVTFSLANPLMISSGTSTVSFTYTDSKAGSPTITAASTSPTTISPATQQETLQSLYQAWLVGYTFATGDDQSATGNPDGDAWSNLQEYAFGTNPTNGAATSIAYAGVLLTSSGPPQAANFASGTGWDYRAVFCRRVSYASIILTYTVQFSADNLVWVDSTVTPTVLATDAGNVMQAVYVRYPLFIRPGGVVKKAQFFRVGVSTAP